MVAGRRVPVAQAPRTGYRVALPNGATVPPLDAAPFLTLVEARVEQRRNGGGTIRPVALPAVAP